MRVMARAEANDEEVPIFSAHCLSGVVAVTDQVVRSRVPPVDVSAESAATGTFCVVKRRLRFFSVEESSAGDAAPATDAPPREGEEGDGGGGAFVSDRVQTSLLVCVESDDTGPHSKADGHVAHCEVIAAPPQERYFTLMLVAAALVPEYGLRLPASSSEDNARVLLLGLGGGALPHFLASTLAHSGGAGISIVAVENDPGVIALARAYFAVKGLEDDGVLEVRCADAAEFCTSCEEKFDVVFVDVSADNDAAGGELAAPPKAMCCASFYHSCAERCLSSRGIVAVNALPVKDPATTDHATASAAALVSTAMVEGGLPHTAVVSADGVSNGIVTAWRLPHDAAPAQSDSRVDASAAADALVAAATTAGGAGAGDLMARAVAQARPVVVGAYDK